MFALLLNIVRCMKCECVCFNHDYVEINLHVVIGCLQACNERQIKCFFFIKRTTFACDISSSEVDNKL